MDKLRASEELDCTLFQSNESTNYTQSFPTLDDDEKLSTDTSSPLSKSPESNQQFLKSLETPNSANELASDSPNVQSFENESFPQRREEDFRKNYIDRLTAMNIIQPHKRHRPHQTLLIFDWDDTLFPTSFICSMDPSKLQNDSHIRASLHKLDKLVSRLLQKSLRVGIAFIVTNAMKEWVENSSKTYLPITHELINTNRILVISAREDYESLYPKDQRQWKFESFLDLKEILQPSVPTNIICVGDSDIEHEAALNICKNLDQAIVKTIKLKQQPRIEELAKQHAAILEKFESIYTTLRSLTIKLERKSN